MRILLKAQVALLIVAFSSMAFANPKCTHRLASGKNDLFAKTNPPKTVVASKETSTGTETVRGGVR